MIDAGERPWSKALWVTGVAATSVGFAVSIYMAFIVTGIERTLGFSQKIFYFHVPCAWVTYLAFAITAVGSVAYLITRKPRWDQLACSSLEVGTLFTTLVLISGPLWARPTWGAYWVWDSRLTTTLILWLIEIAYLLLRAYVEEPEKAATYGAVVGLIGALDIPIVHYSVKLWRGMHPAVLAQSAADGSGAAAKSGLPPEFLLTLMISLASFTLLFVMLLMVRVRLQAARMQLVMLRYKLFEN